jgi:hypothetical protein
VNGEPWAVDTGTPLAVPLAAAAEVLAIPLELLERAAGQVVPYRHAAGHPVWSLHQLRQVLGLEERSDPAQVARALRGSQEAARLRLAQLAG